MQQVNQLLPAFLPPASEADEPIGPRLVRYYTSEGVVDRPERQGREARYSYRHLLQVLLVRRLLQEGYGLSAIAPLLQTKTNSELEGFLQGGIQLSLETANPALAFLQSLHSRSARHPPGQPQAKSSPHSTPPLDSQPSPAPAAPAPAAPAPAAPALAAPLPPEPTAQDQSTQATRSSIAADPESSAPEHWVHLPLLPGLTLLVREDFLYPQTVQEASNLGQLILQKLEQLKRLSAKTP